MDWATAAEQPLGPALSLLRRLWRMDHAVARFSRGMQRRLGVTAEQRLLVRCVGRYPGITAGRLAVLLHVDPGTVSAALGRLETQGLLERRRDLADGRRVALGLTRRGRRIDAESAGTLEEAVEELLRRCSREQIAAAVAVIDELAGLLEERRG